MKEQGWLRMVKGGEDELTVRITNDSLEKLRLNFSRRWKRDVAHLKEASPAFGIL